MSDHIQQALEAVFGFKEFKQNQEEVVGAILKGRDVFAAMPTGGGKSLCYQLPSMLLGGLTVVISPLIALMKDQVDAARVQGIAAAYLNSTLSEEDAKSVYRELYNNNIKLLYISPERFALDSFVIKLKEFNVSLFAVDEAHCLSEWGHDFRPDYLSLGQIRTYFPDVSIAAFTATATKQVQTDIITKLQLKKPFILRASFDRPEIRYRIQKKTDVKKQILSFIRRHPDESGIIYRTSRKSVESTADFLNANSIRALPYHAGLTDKKRHEHQERFNRDEVQVVVATIAFGMGIDKSNIRFVLHGDLPKSIEGYYQETGRAGRDGEPSECVLYFSRGDAAKITFFINQMEDEAEQQRAFRQLNDMVRFASLNTCRRQQLLEYFEEPHDGGCANCDVCNSEHEEVDMTVEGQKALSAIVRTGQRFGRSHIVDVLRGSSNAKVLKHGHDKIKTYGIGKTESKEYWHAVLDELLGQKCLVQDPERYNALVLTEKGKDLVYGRGSLAMIRSVEQQSQEKFPKGKVPQDKELFQRLKQCRFELARERNIPPYIIFSDRTLKEMSHYQPVTNGDLLKINGVGEKKLEAYGPYFLPVIRDYVGTVLVAGE